MKIRPLLKVSLMSLKYHAFRTFLSALGIVFGVIAVVMMLSVGTGIKQETLAQLEQLGSRHIIMRSVPAEISSQSNQTQIQPSGRPSIKECALVIHHSPDILRWAPLLEMIAPPSVKKQLNDCEIMATSPKYQLIKNLTVKEGRFLCAEDDLKRSRVCVLGWEASRELGEKGKLGGYLRIQNQIFKIVGVLNHLAWSKTTVPALTGRNLNRVIFIPWKTATSFLQGGPGGQNSMEIVLEVKKGVSVIKTGRSLEKIMKHMLKDKSMGVLIPQELLQQMKKTQRNFNLFLGCIACISLLVGGIGIMNIMLVSVSERRKEIGLRMTYGASPADILEQFFAETFFITFLGSLLGLSFGMIGSFGLSYLTGWTLSFSLSAVLMPIGMAFLVGILSGMYPAFQASRLDPILTLRYE